MHSYPQMSRAATRIVHVAWGWRRNMGAAKTDGGVWCRAEAGRIKGDVDGLNSFNKILLLRFMADETCIHTS